MASKEELRELVWQQNMRRCNDERWQDFGQRFDTLLDGGRFFKRKPVACYLERFPKGTYKTRYIGITGVNFFGGSSGYDYIQFGWNL